MADDGSPDPVKPDATANVTTLSPVAALEQLLKIDPASARILSAGIAVFAAAAIVLAYKIDIGTMMQVGLYVIVMALLLIVVANLSKFLRDLLGGTVVLTIIAAILLIIVSAVTDKPKPVYCLLEFWVRCQDVEARIAQANARSIEARIEVPQTIAVPSDAPVAIATPRPVSGAASPATGTATAVRQDIVPVSQQPIFIQFAGLITRESVTSLNAALRHGGWNVMGQSGERVGSAAGLNEVRYSKPDYLPAARALAEAVTATKISADPVTPRLVPRVGENLELWISH